MEGVYLAGMLTSQELINVITKLGIITNGVHASNVVISKGTKKCERLRLMRLRIKTKEDWDGLMTHLVYSLDLGAEIIENGLYEARCVGTSGRMHSMTRWKTMSTQWPTWGSWCMTSTARQPGSSSLSEYYYGLSCRDGVKWWTDEYELGNKL